MRVEVVEAGRGVIAIGEITILEIPAETGSDLTGQRGCDGVLLCV
jgi:hypothetical protein